MNSSVSRPPSPQDEDNWVDVDSNDEKKKSCILTDYNFLPIKIILTQTYPYPSNELLFIIYVDSSYVVTTY